jgi:DNA-binding transcriptional regulator YiaG
LAVRDCLEWHGLRNEHGYGLLPRRFRTTGEQYVHRHVWVLANGPLTSGEHVRHVCDNPPCYLLDHLRSGSRSENMQDMVARGRHPSTLHPELRQGIRQSQAKLTDEAVVFIRANRHFSGPQLAQRFGVSKDLINRVRRYEAWKHV